jgi:hypothetical protein
MPEGGGAIPWAGSRRTFLPQNRTLGAKRRSAPDKPKARGERLPVPAGWRFVTREQRS